LDPADTECGHAKRRRIFLDEFFSFHNHQRQKGSSVLLRDLDLRNLCARAPNSAHERECDQRAMNCFHDPCLVGYLT